MDLTAPSATGAEVVPGPGCRAIRQEDAPLIHLANHLHVVDDVDPEVALEFLKSSPGTGGVGMVEDLFTMPSHRGRRIARALIHHCIADARARGAELALIGASADDTPKSIYAAMGFQPICLTYDCTRIVA